MSGAAPETYKFEAELQQLMSLIINAFYSNKDVFLRELISNASDAIDKIRYKSLTDPSQLDHKKELEVHILPNKEEKILELRDTGIGMTKADLINCLGTIASSGTRAFMEALQAGADVSMIGQFGVGFYAAYLVADRVQVITKHNDDEQYIWESSAGGTYTVTPDETGKPLGRGTLVRLYMKEEHTDYLEAHRIRDIVKKYSSFIQYPIKLFTPSTVESEVTDDEAEDEKTEDADANADAEAEKKDEEEKKDDDDDEPKIESVEDNADKPSKKTKKVTKEEIKTEELNSIKPVWTRRPEDVTKEEYAEFYKAQTLDWEDHLCCKHFSVEGQLQFTSLLFIPQRAPFNLFEKNAKRNNIKLYVRRVFIMDNCEEFVPEYLNFLRGIVDSEDLPLNISREMLQQNKLLQLIKKKVVDRALEMITDLAADKEAYNKFYEHFGRNIKLGVHEDTRNREKLAGLLRFRSSKSTDEYTSMDDYIARMPEKQKDIYYIAGESQEAVESSNFLEDAKKRGYEVLFLVEPIDEYVASALKTYKEKKLVCITKEGVKFDDDEEEKKRLEEYKSQFESLCKEIKSLLGSRVEDVVVSSRNTSAPCLLTTKEYSWSANFERIMKASALRDSSYSYMAGKRVMELNPKDAMIQKIKSMYEANSKDPAINDLVTMIYELALIAGGFALDKPADHVCRILHMMRVGLCIPEKAPEEGTKTESVSSSALEEAPAASVMEEVD